MTPDFPMYTFTNVTEWIFTVFQSFQSSGYMYCLIQYFCLCIRKVSMLRNFWSATESKRFGQKFCYKILMPKEYAPVRVLATYVAEKIILSKTLVGHSCTE
jgi:hypothetical protein